MLHSLLGIKYVKESFIFSPVLIPPFLPYPPNTHTHTFALCAAAHRMSPKCSYAGFTKGSDFSHSRGERGSAALVVDISKAAFSCRYLTRPPHTPRLFFHTALHPPPIPLQCVTAVAVTRWDVRTDNGDKTVDRVSILSGERLQCDKASGGREQPWSLLHFGQNTLVVKTRDRANRDSLKHMV